MAYVCCPNCDRDISDEVEMSKDYDLDGFIVECPHCHKKIDVCCEVEEVSYEVFLADGETEDE